MTIKNLRDLIEQLQAIEKEHGPNLELYRRCGYAYVPVGVVELRRESPDQPWTVGIG